MGDTRETWSWHATLDAAAQRTFLLNTRRALSPAYAAAETLWYLSRTDDTTMLRAYSTKYDQMTGADENGGRAYGAYGARLNHSVTGQDLLATAIEELRGGDSRRAVVGLWRQGDVIAARTGCKDVPCTLSWQFMAREGKLFMTTTMRSNDVWMGMPYDVFANTCVQRLVANALDLAVGDYHHQVTSLHVYERHTTAAVEALTAFDSSGYFWLDCGHNWHGSDSLDRVVDAVACEASTRTGERRGPSRPLPPMLRDLVGCCHRHLTGKSSLILSPLLTKAWELYDAHHRGSRPSRQDDVREATAGPAAKQEARVPPPEPAA